MILIAPKIIPKMANIIAAMANIISKASNIFPSFCFLDIWDRPIAEKTTAKIPTIPKRLRKKEIIPKTNPTIAKII